MPKPDGTIRFCVNYKALNKQTKFDSYPLPNLLHLLSQLYGAKYFIKLDLKSGYWQITLHPKDKEKTTFVTPFGLFQFLVMPFGLSTAPATFQRLMDEVFNGMILKELLVYLDDLLIFGSTFEELLERLEKVLQRLAEFGLTLNAKKCFLGMTEVEFLGHKVSENGIEPTDDKIKAIAELEYPQNVSQIRQFMGLTSFYRAFIPKYSTISRPLNELTKKNAIFNWTHECQNAFRGLKEAITSEAVVLAHPQYDKAFYVYTDASKYGIGAVLAQEGRPVWFISRTLQKAEINYDTREKECLAIIYALDKFRPFLYGKHVTVYTDHGNLRWLFESEQTGRLARWKCKLQQFHLTIAYIPGGQNTAADALSRYGYEPTLELNAMKLRSHAEKAEPLNKPMLKSIKSINWQHEQQKDQVLMNEWEREKKLALQTQDSNQSRYQTRKSKSTFKPPTLKMTILDGILYRKVGERLKIIVPEHLVEIVLALAHNSNIAGHAGSKQVSIYLNDYYFASKQNRIRNFVRACETCLLAKSPNSEHHYETRLPADILERLYVDFKGPYPIDPDHPDDCRYVLTIMDDCSRFLNAVPVRTTSAATAIKALERHWIQLFGPPKEIVVDNGTFKSKKFQHFTKSLGANLQRTAPYAHFQNPIERKHRDLDVKLRAHRHSNNSKWAESLHWAILAINNAQNSATSEAPAMLLYGRVLDPITHERISKNLSLAETRKKANSTAYSTRQKQLKKINSNQAPYHYKVGDKVYITNSWKTSKLDYYFLEKPLTFVGMKATNIALLQTDDNQTVECHLDQIRHIK